jgi:DNA/RNA-binding domain of Phe-tRNA-synthetase-like protein
MSNPKMSNLKMNNDIFGFGYRADLLTQFPEIVGGVLFVTGLQNGPTPAALLDLYQAEQMRVKSRGIAPTETPALVAWRAAFRRFGVNPTQYRSAAEALLRRLDKKGDIPSINCLVDIGNLVSIRYAMPVAMVDTRDLSSPITVHPASGLERFIELDDQSIVHPAEGEVVFTDAVGVVVARRWCWRQSAESAARADTTTLLVTVEGHHAGAHTGIAAALADLTNLLQRFAAGSVVSAVLDKDQPIFPAP